MKSQLFIPEKIKVGYVTRNDTYSKKLAYVIYYDSKGVLRKETSFEGWRDKNIQTDEFENKPSSGFVLNKGILRDGYYGNGHNMVRVYDERGIEFEITVGNLLFILMTTNCNKRELEGEFVYSWNGKELVLLPTGCEEYQSSANYTKLQDKKIGVKNLVAGCSYKTKRQEDLIYLGKFDYYTIIRADHPHHNQYYNNCIKMHIFVDETNNIVPLTNLSTLAVQNTDIPVSNYAEYMDMFYNSRFGSPIESFIESAVEEEIMLPQEEQYSKSNRFFIKKENNTYTECWIEHNRIFDNTKRIYTHSGYCMLEYYTYVLEDKKFEKNYHYDYWGKALKKIYTAEELLNMKDSFIDIKIQFENKQTLSLKSI